MDTQRLEAGLDLWAHIAQTQIDIMQASPDHKIEINNAKMWLECLDLLNNQEWELIFETICELEQHVHFRPHQLRMIHEAMEYYVKHQNRSDRAMDINPRYKQPSWKCCMAMREIWQEIK